MRWTADRWSSRCRQMRGTHVSVTTLWSAELASRSSYSAVRLHVEQLGKMLPLHPCLIGKTSSSPAASILTYYPDYCLTWRLSHYLRHVSLSPSLSSHPASPSFSRCLSPPLRDHSLLLWTACHRGAKIILSLSGSSFTISKWYN